MADSLCGPSNAAKGLVTHTERDRTLYQDRLRGPPQLAGGASFRTQTAPLGGGDATFEAFQRGEDITQPLAADMRGLNLNLNNATGPLAFPVSEYAQARGVRDIQSNFDRSEFHQFQQSRLASGTRYMPDNSTNAVYGRMQMDLNQVNGTGHRGFVAPGATILQGVAARANTHDYGPYHNVGLQAASAVGPVLGQVNNHFSDAQFAAAFGEYDEEEFHREMDNWLADHGEPGAVTAEEMAVINADLEQMADELEGAGATSDSEVVPNDDPERKAQQARVEQAELKRAATNILMAVADNKTEKFQNSSFLALMRRIQNDEVTVKGNNLVDSDTGEFVIGKNVGLNPSATTRHDIRKLTPYRTTRQFSSAPQDTEAEAEAV